MFCKNCGNEIKEGTAFCSNCGAKVVTAKKNDSETVLESINVTATNSDGISRDTYIGKAYAFFYYVGINLRSLRLSRCAVGFNDDHLLYCKGLSKTQVPYGMIKEIKDEMKTSPYVIFCIAVFVLVGIVCIACGGVGYALIAAALAVLSILCRKMRQISIVTTDNKVFKIKVVPKNRETDEFLIYLKNETRIR